METQKYIIDIYVALSKLIVIENEERDCYFVANLQKKCPGCMTARAMLYLDYRM